MGAAAVQAPHDGELAAVESSGRFFRGALRKLIIARDLWCRTPWCGAPIRHADHVTDDADGGPTSSRNGEGLCEACNYTYNAPGWSASATATGMHLVTTTTPTRHRYLSRPPDPPRTTALPPGPSAGRDPLTRDQVDRIFDLIVEDFRQSLEHELPESRLIC